MRRIYYNKGRAHIRKGALAQFRRTRDKIRADHPGLLSSMREHVLNSQELQERYTIDQRKNLNTVEKFVALRSGSKGFQEKLKALLLDRAQSKH